METTKIEGIMYVRESGRALHQGVVYVVGPLRDNDPIIRDLNIIRARMVARYWWCAGWCVICPHMNGGLFDRDLQDHLIMRGHLTLVEFADIIAVCLPPGDERLLRSGGSMEELRVAKIFDKKLIYHNEMGIPIIGDTNANTGDTANEARTSGNKISKIQGEAVDHRLRHRMEQHMPQGGAGYSAGRFDTCGGDCTDGE